MPDLSECILQEEIESSIQMTSHRDFVCDSKIIKAFHSLRPNKDDAPADNVALSLLKDMKSNALNADVVLYNVCIDCFGKVGKVDMDWMLLHEMNAQNIMPDEVTYTT